MIEVDTLDLQLAHALQVDGRASFTRMATVLGVSDQTVARRYTRLRSSRALRVVGLTDPDSTGDTQWYVRVRATPDAAQAVARSLAKRQDTSWVMLLAGGTELLCTARTGSGEAGGDLLLSALPRTARVLDVQAHCRLHQYFGGPLGAVEKLDLLRPDQIAALLDGRPGTPSIPVPVELDQIDHSILGELSLDGRSRLDRLASVASAPVATVRRRLDALRDHGVLYFDVELDNRLLARSVEAVLWIKVEPAALHAAGTALAAHREVAFAAACTGPFALLAYVSTADPSSLYRYLTTSVATLPGIREIESAPVISLLKGPGGVR
jgi:DNA-binding Lrp family transcriptional regulator